MDRRQPPAAPARVLVVDDEPLVARSVARSLRGYAVETAGSATEALELIQGGARYDALVCDLMMPGMSGMDLAERLASVAPALAQRMVFLTGGAFTPEAREFVERSGATVVEKPFDLAELRARVEAVVSGA